MTAQREEVKTWAGNVGGLVRHEYKTVLPNVINLRDIPESRLAVLRAMPGVVKVEEDRTMHAHLTVSTPLIRALQSQITGAGHSADGSGTRVCIVDTGIDSDHIMFSSRIDTAAGWDFVNNDPNPEDDNGHGSNVAGISVGGTGISLTHCSVLTTFQGIAPNATLIGMKVLDQNGSGSFSDVIAGIDRCADPALPGGQADVINLSLGGGAFSGNCDSDSAAIAANNAVDAGVVVVASAGNECNSNQMGTPACGSKVIAVGAVYDDDFPNCESPTQNGFTWCCDSFCFTTCTDNGPAQDSLVCFSNASTTIDVAAPGCIITSADNAAGGTTVSGICGTSQASPHVAGLAALILSKDGTLTPAEVRQIIRDGAIDMGPAGFDSGYGWGRVDAINSLDLVAGGCTSDAQCDDGLYCNGAETCDIPSGSCQAGTAPNCDDGVGCTNDSCNEATNSCDNVASNGNCDDGLFCNGAETCSATLDCQAGTDPCPGQICDEGTNTCNDCIVDGDCDDGVFCNGAETCVGGACQAGTAVNCDDGVACTDDSCNEGTNSCDNVANDANCDNGLFCNGSETCNATLDCQSGTAVNCDDGVGCTDDSCNEGTNSCDNVANDANCPNDGLFCNGTEFCDAAADCGSTGDPCGGAGCDEVNDTCTGPAAQLEGGSVTVGATAVTVSLTNSYISPVIVATAQYNNTIPVVTRITNVTSTSFDVYLQNPGDLSTPVADNISYLVVEQGSWTIDGVNVEAQTYSSTVTDENNSWVGQVQRSGQSYTNPVVVGQVMSVNDPDWSVFWCQGNTRTNPPSSTDLATGKHVAEDPVVARADEIVGFIVFESSHGTIGGVEFEAALGPDTVRGAVDAPPYTYTFNTAFASAPTVGIATIGGMDGGNGGWGQIHGPTLATTTKLNLSIDEDQINDAERNRTTDQIGYVVFAGPVVYPPAPQCGVPADCDDGLFCNGVEDCVSGTCVAGTAPNCDDGVACTDDACNEATNSCDNVPNNANCPDDGLFCNGTEFCDAAADCSSTGDPCLAGEVCNETTNACDPGSAAKLETGTVSVGSGGVTVNLTNSYTSPVVVCSVNYNNNTIPVVARVSAVTSTSFNVRLQNAGAGTVAAETVHYLVVEEGTWTIDGVNIEAQLYNSTVTDENNSWVAEARTYGQSYTTPVVLGQVMSENDPDWSVFWDQGTSRTTPPSSGSLRTGKTVCEDSNTTRADETVGFVVIEAGSGTINGVAYRAGLGADTVQGIGNAPPYIYTFGSAFGSTPQIGIVTMAAVDGNNGGWAYLYGASPLSTTAVDLVIDEDTIGDGERWHTTEQVFYLVFESAVTVP